MDDFEIINKSKIELVNVLGECNVMSSREIMKLDWGEDYKVNEYFSKFNYFMSS